MDKEAAIILTQSKNVALGVVLTFLFGGFGVFYASILGGLIMSITEAIGLAISFMTLGIMSFMMCPIHIVAIIWAIAAINKHNQRLIASVSYSSSRDLYFDD